MRILGLLLSFLCLCGEAYTTAATAELAANKALVVQSHEKVWSQGNVELIDELYASDFICHFLIGPDWVGPTGVKDRVISHRAAFPDWTEEVEQLIAEGDFVVVRFRASGTNEGSFRGSPPTGRRVSISEVAIYRIADGKIAEQWGFPDLLKMHRQLGLIELPETGSQ